MDSIKIEPSINSLKIEPHINKVKIELIHLKDDTYYLSPYQAYEETLEVK